MVRVCCVQVLPTRPLVGGRLVFLFFCNKFPFHLCKKTNHPKAVHRHTQTQRLERGGFHCKIERQNKVGAPITIRLSLVQQTTKPVWIKNGQNERQMKEWEMPKEKTLEF